MNYRLVRSTKLPSRTIGVIHIFLGDDEAELISEALNVTIEIIGFKGFQLTLQGLANLLKRRDSMQVITHFGIRRRF